MPVCRYIKGDGTQCRGSSTESGYCFQHDPELRDERAKVNARAAVPPRASLGKSIRRPKTREDLEDIISTCVKSLWEGKVDHKRAKAIMDVCKFQLKLIKEREAEKPPEDEIATMTQEQLEAEVRKMTGGKS
jgi:hypothetical protein